MIRLLRTGQDDVAAILRRRTVQRDDQTEQIVRAIIEDVRRRGDAALLDSARKFDAPGLQTLEVTAEDLRGARSLSEAHAEALGKAAIRIRQFHGHQMAWIAKGLDPVGDPELSEIQTLAGPVPKADHDLTWTMPNGPKLGQRVRPVASAGVYVPGGNATYPSSVLMNAIPARCAGVRDVYVTTPARADGTMHPAVLTALREAGVTRAFKVGIADRVGSIDVGKDADIVIWDGHPLSTYSRVNTTLIDGEVFFQRRDAFNVNGSSTIKTKLDPFKYVPNTPLPPKSNLYAIVGATVHSVDKPAIVNGTVLVENGKIRAVGKSVVIPKNAVKVNAAGMHVYPGFIDAGTTIGLTEYGQIGQATDAREFGNYQPDLVALTAVQPWSEHIATTLCQGVTTVFTQPMGGSVSGQGSILNTAGWTNELMGLKPKAGLCLNWSGGGGGGFDQEHQDDSHEFCGDGSGSDSPEMGGGQGPGGGDDGGSLADIRNYFDRAIKYGQSHDKIDLSMEAMQPYVRGQLPVYIRVNNRAGIVSAAEFAKKYKLKAVLIGAPEAWKEAKLLASQNIPVILSAPAKSTLGANTTVNDWDPYDTPYATAALLKRAGVKFCFQTASYADAKDIAVRAASTCAYGLSREDALRSITLSAAEILGISDKVGSLTPGKHGNLVISDGDPFEMTSNIRYVFVNGQPVKLESKFTRLRDKYLQRVQ